MLSDLERYNLCTRCGGYGYFTVQTGDETFETRDCGYCFGHGHHRPKAALPTHPDDYAWAMALAVAWIEGGAK